MDMVLPKPEETADGNSGVAGNSAEMSTPQSLQEILARVQDSPSATANLHESTSTHDDASLIDFYTKIVLADTISMQDMALVDEKLLVDLAESRTKLALPARIAGSSPETNFLIGVMALNVLTANKKIEELTTRLEALETDAKKQLTLFDINAERIAFYPRPCQHSINNRILDLKTILKRAVMGRSTKSTGEDRWRSLLSCLFDGIFMGDTIDRRILFDKGGNSTALLIDVLDLILFSAEVGPSDEVWVTKEIKNLVETEISRYGKRHRMRNLRQKNKATKLAEDSMDI